MFLSTNNKIKWKLLGIATAVVVVTVALGIAWFDKPLYLFMRHFDCAAWGWFDKIFDAKMWVGASFVLMCAFYGKKIVQSKPCLVNSQNKFSIFAFFRDFIVKTKNSYAFFVFCSVLSASILAKVLKVLIGRARPIFFEALDMTGFFPFSYEWAFNSMPSGHTVATFAGLVMLGMLAPRAKWFTWTLAIIVGASRVAYGAHWPTDVILGAFIGMVMADFAKAILKRYQAKFE